MWRLGESAAVIAAAIAANGFGTTADSGPNALTGRLVGTATFGAASLVPGDANTAMSIAGAGLIEIPQTTVTTFPFTVSLRVQRANTTLPTGTDQILFCLGKRAGLEQFWVEYYNDGFRSGLRCVVQGGGSTRTYMCACAIDTVPHTITAVFTSASSVTIYFEGVAQTIVSLVGSPLTPADITHAFIGGLVYGGNSDGTGGTQYGRFSGIIDEVQLVARAITSTEAAAYHADAIAPAVTAASINAAGTTLALTFSEAVTGLVASQYKLSGLSSLGSATGSGANWTMTITPAVRRRVYKTLAYTGTGTVNGASAAMTTFASMPVTNNMPVLSPFRFYAGPMLAYANFTAFTGARPSISDAGVGENPATIGDPTQPRWDWAYGATRGEYSGAVDLDRLGNALESIGDDDASYVSDFAEGDRSPEMLGLRAQVLAAATEAGFPTGDYSHVLPRGTGTYGEMQDGNDASDAIVGPHCSLVVVAIYFPAGLASYTNDLKQYHAQHIGEAFRLKRVFQRPCLYTCPQVNGGVVGAGDVPLAWLMSLVEEFVGQGGRDIVVWSDHGTNPPMQILITAIAARLALLGVVGSVAYSTGSALADRAAGTYAVTTYSTGSALL